MLIKITSSDNKRVKLVKKLASRRGRSEEGRFTAEGRNMVSGVLERGLDIDFIMIPDSLAASGSVPGFIEDCISSSEITVCEINARDFEKLTDAEYGIDMLAVVRKDEKGESALDGLAPADNLLVLDRIQDPGNMGTLIRTAAAAGYKAVLLMNGTVDIYSPKVLRATAGLIFAVPFIYVADAAELRRITEKTGKRLAVTVPEGGKPYFEEDLSEGIALVIGNEGRGICDEIIAMADLAVTLPMKNDVESLNAGVAAGILMYEAMRK